MSGFIKFADEPQDYIWQETQSILEHIGMPPMVPFTGNEGEAPIDPENVLRRINPIKLKIKNQINNDGYIKQAEAGNMEVSPLYICWHNKLGLGMVCFIKDDVRVMFLNNISSSQLTGRLAEH